MSRVTGARPRMRDDLYQFFLAAGVQRCPLCGKMKHYCPKADTFFCVDCTPKVVDGIGLVHWKMKKG